MTSKSSLLSEPIQNIGQDDRLRALDESEKEYNRMISKHTTYHKMLMDDLMKLSSESGSGSNNLIQQQLAQTNQSKLVRGIGDTIGNLNTTNQWLMKATSDLKADTTTKAQTMSELNNVISQKRSKLNEIIQAYNELKEGFADQNTTMDAALEVSNRVKESHKYAFVIFGIVAIYAVYKTIKQL
jgi:hypothetical protein